MTQSGGIDFEQYVGTYGAINTGINLENATGNLFSGFNFPSNAVNAFFNMSGKLRGDHKITQNLDLKTWAATETFSMSTGEKKRGIFVLSRSYMVVVKDPGKAGTLVGKLTESQITYLRNAHSQGAAYRFGGKIEIEIEVTRAASDQGLWHIHSLALRPVTPIENPWFANTNITFSASFKHEDTVACVEISCMVNQTGNIACVPSEIEMSTLVIYADGRVSEGEGPLFAGLGSQLCSEPPPQPAGATKWFDALRLQAQVDKRETVRNANRAFDEKFPRFVKAVARQMNITPDENIEGRLRAGVMAKVVVIYDISTGVQWLEHFDRRQRLVRELGDPAAEGFIESLLRDGYDEETIKLRYQQRQRGRGLPAKAEFVSETEMSVTIGADEYVDQEATTRAVVGDLPPDYTWKESVSNRAGAAADVVGRFAGEQGDLAMRAMRVGGGAFADWWNGGGRSTGEGIEANPNDSGPNALQMTRETDDDGDHQAADDPQAEEMAEIHGTGDGDGGGEGSSQVQSGVGFSRGPSTEEKGKQVLDDDDRDEDGEIEEQSYQQTVNVDSEAETDTESAEDLRGR